MGTQTRRELTYRGARYPCRDKETVLEALQRQGVTLSFSCRSGICHVCLQRCTSGPIPEVAQTGLRPTLRAQGYFLPCRCTPSADMVIEPPRNADLYTPAVVYGKEWLAPDVIRLRLEAATTLLYRPGQFINLRRSDGLARSYSLASDPATDYFLELHVRVMKNGAMSNWIADALQVNDEIDIQGPNGHCCYETANPKRNMLLVGTGTGLAPLVGIARDALHQGHEGELHLFHGTRHAEGIYLRQELLDLCGRFPNFHYYACISGNDVPSGYLAGRAHEVALSLHEDLRGWSVHLAGLPDMVDAAHRDVLRAGAAESDIHADPFRFTDLRRGSRRGASTRGNGDADGGNAAGRNTRVFPAATPAASPVAARDAEMWEALQQGPRLTAILADFYTRVFEDPRLNPFFRGTSKERMVEKQYLFLRQQFSGEKVYSGCRPRNAHHWMLISDELYDHREALLETVLRDHQFPTHLIERWLAMDNSFRADIVKHVPWKRVIDGVELPMDGIGETVLQAGTLCDACGAGIEPGTRVRYHLRHGTTWCPSCMPETGAAPLRNKALRHG